MWKKQIIYILLQEFRPHKESVRQGLNVCFSLAETNICVSEQSRHCIRWYRIMHESPWITIYWSRMRRFANNLNEWRSHEWKSLVNRIRSDPEIVIHCNKSIIIFLTRYFMSWIHNSAKKNYRSLISSLSLRVVFSDLALWRHHSWFVTSRERGASALWRHSRRMFLRTQIGAKAIATVKINYSPPGIHGLACEIVFCLLFVPKGYIIPLALNTQITEFCQKI